MNRCCEMSLLMLEHAYMLHLAKTLYSHRSCAALMRAVYHDLDGDGAYPTSVGGCANAFRRSARDDCANDLV